MENSGSVNQQTAGKAKTTITKVNEIIGLLGTILFRLRKAVIAAPVVYYALKIASYNQEHLPEDVGILLLSSGEFAMTVARSLAVTTPLALTAACLLLMFCSRKTLYPWAISVFTLALPVVILFSNIYPA